MTSAACRGRSRWCVPTETRFETVFKDVCVAALSSWCESHDEPVERCRSSHGHKPALALAVGDGTLSGRLLAQTEPDRGLLPALLAPDLRHTAAAPHHHRSEVTRTVFSFSELAAKPHFSLCRKKFIRIKLNILCQYCIFSVSKDFCIALQCVFRSDPFCFFFLYFSKSHPHNLLHNLNKWFIISWYISIHFYLVCYLFVHWNNVCFSLYLND